MADKPLIKPERPWFSAGPTAKRPGYALEGLPTNLLGRGIRAPEVVERFAHGLRLTREVLEVPDDFVMLYTPGSDTGAVEAALWGMLGARGVQVIARRVEGVTGKELGALADQMRGGLGTGAVLVMAEDAGKATVAATVTPDLADRLSAWIAAGAKND